MVKISKKSPPKSAKRSARRRRRRELSAWKRFRLQGWRKKLHSSRPDHPPAEEMAMRAELFGVSQLENYAQVLARNHTIEVVREPEKLLLQLGKSAEEIHRCHEIIAESVRHGHRIAPAGEWLLDNYHLIQEQIELARAHLPPGYSRELPRLTSGPRRGFPRIYDVVMELVRHSDGQVDLENLSRFIDAYQSVHALTLGELWAVPIMLRLCLIENLHLVAQRIAWRRSQRDAALVWANHFLRVVEDNPRQFVTVLGDFVRDAPVLTPPFVAELVANIDGVNPALGLALNWLEQELSDHGQSIERIQQGENQAQAANHVTTGNSITSMRALAAIDWKDFVESLSAVEVILRRDPTGVYPLMDFPTRNRYRTQIEKLARHVRCTESVVAETTIDMAAESRRGGADRRQCHVGYFLIAGGRRALEKRLSCSVPIFRHLGRFVACRPLALYLAALVLLTIALLALPLTILNAMPVALGLAIPLALVAAFALTRPAISIVNWLVTLFLPPAPLPSLDFEKEIPADHRTIVVVPTFLGPPAAAARLLEDLEIRYLANKLPNLHFALLTDFPDADTETLPTDRAWIEAAVQGIRRLNKRHTGTGETRFFLLHRPRVWNPGEGKWMGRERKRGKLEDFNHLVIDHHSEAFSVIEGDIQLLRDMRFAITLDTDTQLPPGAAARLAGSMAHLLNRPQLDPATRLVTSGYAILQPRLAVSLTSARRSFFSRLLAGEVGIDPYTREIANVYQDLFGQGQFVGKGIYDIQAFHAATSKRFPDNRILSHDLIEGCHARCGFIGDVELIENEPSRYLADVNRRHRWTRGDWQIAAWLGRRVPGPDGVPVRNPLARLARWMIFDNLRRSLVPTALLLALGGAGLLPPPLAGPWIATLLALLILPALLRTLRAFAMKGPQVPLVIHLRAVAVNETRGWALDLLDLLFIPYQAVNYLDAIVRVFARRVSGRHLLEWQTAHHTERTARTSLVYTVWEMISAPLLAATCIGLAWLAHPGSLPPALVALGAAWALSPGLAWLISRTRPPRGIPLRPAQRAFLRRLARRTWAFFDHFIGPESRWLPPDNFQQSPEATADRTSPTNIGLALTSTLAAHDFGYLSPGRLLDRVGRTFGTLERLERYRGHFYNWYDLRTLRPLHPHYVSTVDSGNLVGMLIVLRQGLAELLAAPILPANWRDGLIDTLAVLAEESRDSLPKASRKPFAEATARWRAALHGPAPALRDAADFLATLSAELEALDLQPDSESECAFWLEALRHQAADVLADLHHMAPWLLDPPPTTDALPEELQQELESIPTLQSLATLPHRWTNALASRPAATDWIRHIRLAGDRATERIGIISSHRERCAELAINDLDFLYDADRHLFSIGYNLDARDRDPGYYDLLASECRLGSYIGVASGELPLEHWFHLGRRLAPGAGPPALASWSGSMFEYLMPMLVMPSYDGTLLHETCRESVRRQIRYGRRAGVPWGISESGYNQVDAHHIYQYRPFGVPTLGMKRGLADDLVIAPYASALALMVEPRASTHNLERLAAKGLLGRYGLYEAVDYTPARIPVGEPFAIVRSWMAHHSGMALLAINHLLHAQPMPRRFTSDPQLKSALLLLQERIPLVRPRARPTADVAETAADRSEDSFEAAYRSFDTANTPTPEVHLMTNGTYHVMVSNAGGGYSRWKGLDLTRWREDAATDQQGLHLFLREVDTNRAWTPTLQPLVPNFDRYEAIFSQGGAEFQSVLHQFQNRLQIAVCPEDDMELRQLTLTNLSRRARTIEITSYAEVVLFNGPSEAAHPAFNKLFVQSHTARDKASLVFTRRPRAADDTHPWMFHTLLVAGGTLLRGATFETNRAAFIGRGRTLRNPAGLDIPGPLPDREGLVLDPIAAIRYRVRIEAGATIRVNAFLGIAPDRPAVDTYVDRCHDPRMPDRVFSLAWTRSQVLLHQLRVNEADVQNYARLAGSLLYAGAHRRGRASIIAANRRNQAALWSYGISGDRPIVLLAITDQANLDLVRNLVQAHTYWRQKGLEVDLVIWSEAYAGYRQNLLDAIIGLVQAGTEGKLLDQPGGIFVRNIDQIPEEDRTLFRAVARLVFSDRYGTLADQIDRRVVDDPDIPELVPTVTGDRYKAPPPAAARQLEYFNGLGGFTHDGREYIIQTEPSTPTPAPWVNVLANADFGTVISEAGSAYTWKENAHQFRLTPWHNDPVSDPTGEAFYIRDDETGRLWSPMPGPATGRGATTCRHGHGYSVFERTEEGLATTATVHVALDAPLKFTTIVLKNISARPRHVSIAAYVEWVLGERREQNAMHVVSHLDPQSGALFAQNAFSLDFADRIAFFHCSAADRSLTANRLEFIGRNGSLADPEALHRLLLSNRVGAGLDPCAAFLAPFEIPPGDQIQITFTLGAA
ncbi:MAG: glucoamylase family protein, partial [Kiritimatiellae bacterium]|nr:glucoamylase family protein [Kiritimatiellia bacterium]